MKQYKEEVLMGLVVLVSCVFMIYMGVNHMNWKEDNCEKEYYGITIRTCTQRQNKPMTAGKVVYFQQVCVKYKDTVVQRWRYKCPPKKHEL